MIKFFRKIRQNLLSEGKTGKYLKYAIGEIVLVIIGILIALQINNANELRKTEKKIVSILKEVQNDLALDIQKSDELMAYYSNKDSIIRLIQADKLTYEDYKNDDFNRLRNILTGAFHIKIHVNGYNNLMENVDNIPEYLKKIIDPLNEIYVYNKYEIDKFDLRIDKVTDRMIDYLAANKEWYYKSKKSVLTDTMIDYYMTDPYYKNATEIYDNAGYQNLSKQVKLFRVNAVRVYKKINTLLKNKDSLPDFIPHNLVDLTPEQLQDYVGTYQFVEIKDVQGIPDVKFKFFIKDNQLVRNSDNNLEIRGLYFKSLDNAFEQEDIYKRFEFIRNDANQITGAIFKDIVTIHLEKLKDE
ncbi:DUF6090 family protein [Flavobacteriaceae bacterium LMO-SS05]